MRPRLLDLFCCEGGAAAGYHAAGFDVIGVDIEARPNYPYPFIQGDALAPPVRWSDFAAVHASPPCQHYSAATKATGNPDDHPDLVAPTRAMLEETGLPYVIENVVGAPVRRDLMLCGSMFGLDVQRHRLFELGGWLLWGGAPPCRHYEHDTIYDVTGGAGGPNQTRRHWNGRTVKYHNADHARELMSMPWATRYGCTQAIPPAYTEFIGRELLAAL